MLGVPASARGALDVRTTIHDDSSPLAADHPGYGSGRLLRRRVRRTRKSQALAHRGPSARRPAHDDDRGRQLAGRRRGPARARPHGPHAPARRTLRRRNRLRPGHSRRPWQATVPSYWGEWRIYLRRAHHRDRRIGTLSRARLGNRVPRSRSLRLRHLRRFLLPRPQGGRGRRRQHRGRGSHLPHQHRRARHARAPPRPAARRGHPPGPHPCARRTRQGLVSVGSRSRRGARQRGRRHRRACPLA